MLRKIKCWLGYHENLHVINAHDEAILCVHCGKREAL